MKITIHVATSRGFSSLELSDGELNLATYYSHANAWTWTGREVDETALWQHITEEGKGERFEQRMREVLALAPWRKEHGT